MDIRLRARVARLGGAAVLAVLGWVMASPAFAGEPQGVAIGPEQAQDLDEVTVMGKRLYQMREDLVAAEERFFALYNELNTDDAYDVHCVFEAPLGTRLKRRVCRPGFIERAQEQEVRAFITGEFAPSVHLVEQERRAEYRKTMADVVNSDPRLLRLLLERDRLEQRYKKAHQERFKGRWVLFE
jgi:hypothetical protein